MARADGERRSCESWRWLVSVVLLAPLLAGCEALAITALGVGASAGVSHTASGVSTRTFTAPAEQVKKASLAALAKMHIAVDAIDRQEAGGELIKARSADRNIEIEIESMSKATTHMRAAAKRNAFVYDAATGREIVEQTALALAGLERRDGERVAPRREPRPAKPTAARPADAPRPVPAALAATVAPTTVARQ